MNKEEKIKELKQLIKDYEIVLRIHTEQKELSSRKEYANYIDSVLDEINIIRRQIEKLEKE